MRPLLILAALACLTGAAAAAEADSPTVLNLTESAETSVVPDLAILEMRGEAKDRDPQTAQRQVNQRMAAALAEAKAVSGVTVTVDAYQVYQEGRPAEAPADPLPWHAQQSLTLRSTDAQTLTRLAGNLQERGLLMSNQYFAVSAELRHDTRQRLIKEALERLRRTAASVAQSMAMTVAGYRSIHLDAGQPSIRPVMAMAVREAAPAAAPGEQAISLSVSAEVLLTANQK